MKTLIIGAGNMGKTYAQSFLASHIVRPQDLAFSIRREAQRESLSREFPAVQIVVGIDEAAIAAAELLIIAVKPQDSAMLFQQIATHIQPSQVVLSVMAGVKMAALATALGTEKVLRAMPNLPAQIGMGMTAFTASDAVSKHELVAIQNLLSTTGRAMYFDDETMIDASTAVSGSGPAFVFYFMDAMLRAAGDMGFTPSQAELLVWQTFNGAIHLINKYPHTCGEWIQRVASKGGTTEAALRVFEQQEVSVAIQAGLDAAFTRAKELGK